MSCGDPSITTTEEPILTHRAPHHHNRLAGHLAPLELWRCQLHQNFQRGKLVDTTLGGQLGDPPALCQLIFASGSSGEAGITTTPEGPSGHPAGRGAGGCGE